MLQSSDARPICQVVSWVVVLVLVGGLSGPVKGEVSEVRVAQQFGIAYLPLQMMRQKGLIEVHAKKLGLGDLKVTWSRFSGGRAMNDALLSGNLDFASGGITPLLTIWAKTQGTLDIKGVAALNTMELYLNTNRPNIKSLKDFSKGDRIALPAAKVSIMARTLQMAAEQTFGVGKHDVLDKQTVSMKHPDGVVALRSGQSGIVGHFTSPPFMYQELQDPKIHKVLGSFDVLGGPSTFTCLWARASFRDQNPKTYQAFVNALAEAMELINADKAAAARVYKEQTKSKLDLAFLQEIVENPDVEFTMVPLNTMKYADFMYRIGAIKKQPTNWKDYFFPEVHSLPGS